MLYMLSQAWYKIQDFDEIYFDKRAHGLFLMNRKFFALTALYIFFVKYFGPKMMEHRKPFVMRNILIAYNILQIILNTYVLAMSLHIIYKYSPYPNLACMMPVGGESQFGLLELHVCHSYFLLKVLDFMDTVFFVLRKKYHQISFLHFFHHIAVSVGSFYIVRYYAGGHSVVLGLLNLFVHAVMYSYYLLSVLKVDMAKHSWWKKYITLLQIVQFAINIVHHVRALVSPDCQYSKPILLIITILNVIMVVLFGNFYKKTYIEKRTKNTNYNK